MSNVIKIVLITPFVLLFGCKKIEDKRYKVTSDCNKFKVYKPLFKTVDSIKEANEHIYYVAIDTATCEMDVKFDLDYLPENVLTNIFLKKGLILVTDSTKYDPTVDTVNVDNPIDTVDAIDSTQVEADTNQTVQIDSAAVDTNSTIVQDTIQNDTNSVNDEN